MVRRSTPFSNKAVANITQAVDAHPFADSGLGARPSENALGRGPADVCRPAGAGKQPQGRTLDLPIVPQVSEQRRRKHGVAVLAPLALLHPDEHPVRMAVDIGDAQLDQFTDPQPGRVGGHQQHPVLGVGRGLEQPFQFLLAQDFGQA